MHDHHRSSSYRLTNVYPCILLHYTYDDVYYTTGYGRVGLKSVLPLAQRPSNKYDLFVYDQATILPDQTLTFAVTVSTASKRLK